MEVNKTSKKGKLFLLFKKKSKHLGEIKKKKQKNSKEFSLDRAKRKK